MGPYGHIFEKTVHCIGLRLQFLCDILGKTIKFRGLSLQQNVKHDAKNKMSGCRLLCSEQR